MAHAHRTLRNVTVGQGLLLALVLPVAARAQDSVGALLGLASSRADSAQIASLLRSGASQHLPLLVGADGTRVYASLEGVVEEERGVLRAWIIFAPVSDSADASRARLDCESGRIAWLQPTVRGVTTPALTVPPVFGRAICLLVDAAAAVRSYDAGGSEMREARRLDSVTFHAQRWRPVVGTRSLEIAPESRRETRNGMEAWLRFINQSRGRTVAVVEAQCDAKRVRFVEGKWSDSLGVDHRLVETEFARVAPESGEEDQLRAICSPESVVQWRPATGDRPPAGLLATTPTALPATTVQTVLNGGPRPWLGALLRRGDARQR